MHNSEERWGERWVLQRWLDFAGFFLKKELRGLIEEVTGPRHWRVDDLAGRCRFSGDAADDGSLDALDEVSTAGDSGDMASWSSIDSYERSLLVKWTDSANAGDLAEVGFLHGSSPTVEKRWYKTKARFKDASYECSIGSSANKASSLRFLTQDFNGGRTMSLNRKVPYTNRANPSI